MRWPSTRTSRRPSARDARLPRHRRAGLGGAGARRRDWSRSASTATTSPAPAASPRCARSCTQRLPEPAPRRRRGGRRRHPAALPSRLDRRPATPCSAGSTTRAPPGAGRGRHRAGARRPSASASTSRPSSTSTPPTRTPSSGCAASAPSPASSRGTRPPGWRACSRPGSPPAPSTSPATVTPSSTRTWAAAGRRARRRCCTSASWCRSGPRSRPASRAVMTSHIVVSALDPQRPATFSRAVILGCCAATSASRASSSPTPSTWPGRAPRPVSPRPRCAPWRPVSTCSASGPRHQRGHVRATCTPLVKAVARRTAPRGPGGRGCAANLGARPRDGTTAARMPAPGDRARAPPWPTCDRPSPALPHRGRVTVAAAPGPVGFVQVAVPPTRRRRSRLGAGGTRRTDAEADVPAGDEGGRGGTGGSTRPPGVRGRPPAAEAGHDACSSSAAGRAAARTSRPSAALPPWPAHWCDLCRAVRRHREARDRHRRHQDRGGRARRRRHRGSPGGRPRVRGTAGSWPPRSTSTDRSSARRNG